MRLLYRCLGFYLIYCSTIYQAALTIQPGILTVGVSPGAPPLLYIENGSYTGLEADYARLIANELKLKLEFVSFTRGNLISALEANEVDIIMNGLKIMPDHDNKIHYLPPYMNSSQMAIILYENILKLGRPGQLYRADKTIGVLTESYGEILAEKEIADGVIKKYSTVALAFTALRDQEIHYFIHKAPTSWQLARDLTTKDLQSLYKPLSKDELAFAVNKYNPELIQKIGSLFRNWKQQGIVEMINRRWIKARMEVK